MRMIIGSAVLSAVTSIVVALIYWFAYFQGLRAGLGRCP